MTPYDLIQVSCKEAYTFIQNADHNLKIEVYPWNVILHKVWLKWENSKSERKFIVIPLQQPIYNIDIYK